MSSAVLKQMEDIKEETGLTCCICREGYRYQPQKVPINIHISPDMGLSFSLNNVFIFLI